MALDQVRQASKVLGPLLRRRGTSPALGTTLRRGLQALDKAFSGLAVPAQEETIVAGIAELRACLELIRGSDRPADHEQLEGIEKALALLGPMETALPTAPMPDLVLAPAQEKRPAYQPVERPSRSRIRPGADALDFRTVGLLLLGYSAELEMLQVVVSEPLFKVSDLELAHAGLQKRVHALKWLGKDRIPEILRVADDAKSLGDRLAAGAALVHLGDAHGAEMVIGLLGKAATDKQPLPDTSQLLLRTLADEQLLQWLLGVFNVPVHPTVCGLLLPLLAERKLLSGEQLWRLTEHPKDEIAVEAAQALPWSDEQFDTDTLIAWASQSRTPRRSNALLFAATVLGSAAALAQVRARLLAIEAQAAGDIDRLLIDALAVAGDASDAALLTRLAGQFEDDAVALLLAAANLGSAETLALLHGLHGVVAADVLAEVHRMIAGRGADDVRGRPTMQNTRMLRGHPWSVEGLLACLQAPDETLQAQRQMALELRARTGEIPLSTLPMFLPASARPGLLANWSTYYAKAHGRLRPGQWYYQGKPMAPSARETLPLRPGASS